MLLSGSGDELCGLLPALFHLYLHYFIYICLLLALFPFQPLFTEILSRDQLFAPPRFSGVLSATLSPAVC
jgi:hypothetical protein